MLGALLGFVILKPPSASEAAWVADLLGWTIAVAIVLLLAAEATGLVPSWYDLYRATELMAAERVQYWVPLADVLGLDARWAGPFVHPGRTGEVGALLLVWGMTRAGATRAVLVAVGVLTLLVASSRTSYLGAAAGVGVVLLVAWWPRLTRALRGIAAAGAVVAGAGLLFVVVGANTGLTGRTSIWPAYLELWAGSPLWGAGEAGIGEAQGEGLLPAWAYHAHSLWLDVLARYGAVAFVAVVRRPGERGRRGRRRHATRRTQPPRGLSPSCWCRASRTRSSTGACPTSPCSSSCSRCSPCRPGGRCAAGR